MKATLLFICCCFPLGVLAQVPKSDSPFKARNTIYVEGLGSGGFYSVNYERLVLLKTTHAFGYRAGASYYGMSPNRANLIGEVFALLGTGKHHADFGLGLTASKASWGELMPGVQPWDLYAVPRASYRYQKPTGGLMLRAGFTPTFKLTRANATNHGPWGGVAVGYSF